MVVIITERTPRGMLGLMSRLTVEFKPGVFVGNLNARVREKLWKKICDKWHLDAIMIFTTNNEQGFDVWKYGETSRIPINIEGIILSTHTLKKKNI